MGLNEQLKEEIDSRDYKKMQNNFKESMPKLKQIMEKMETKESTFVETEFSRHNVKLTKGNFIIISELKEDQAKSLFDRICQLT